MRNSKEECLAEIEVILELMSEYENRLSSLAKQYSEKKAELESYEDTNRIIAANEPPVEDVEQYIMEIKLLTKEPILTGV